MIEIGNGERPVEWSPQIISLSEVVVRPDEPILIGDITSSLRPGINPADLAMAVEVLVGTTFRAGAKYVDGSMLAQATKGFFLSGLYRPDESTTLLFFPGSGAKAVIRESENIGNFLYKKGYFLDTARIVDKGGKVQNVLVTFPSELDNWLRQGSVSRVIVVDDVIATGKTLSAIAAMIRTKAPSPVELEAISWFCRNPTETGGYSRVQSVFRYRSIDGWPALNSLSTLMGTSEKSKMVRSRFIKRFVRYPYGFLKQLSFIVSLLESRDNL